MAAALGIALLMPNVRQVFDLAQLAWSAFQVSACELLVTVNGTVTAAITCFIVRDVE